MERFRCREFNKPTQVMYWDADGDHWVGGIAYGTEIICGCCGGIINIDEVYEFAPEEVINPIVIFNYWVDLSEEIIGEDINKILDEIN